MESIQSITLKLMDENISPCSLRQEILTLKEQLTVASDEVNTSSDITLGETMTKNGLAVSPTMAIMCVDDFVRTIIFMRGLFAAIKDINSQHPERPASVLYAGCGPLATLAIPLMHVFSSEQVTFSMLDLHQESINSVNSIVKKLAKEKWLSHIEKIDASDYSINPKRPPDIIILEIMQACLEKEPQVAVSQHLIAQAPKAILIPQEININLVMVDTNKEFSFNGNKEEQDRILIDTVLTVNKRMLQRWATKDVRELPSTIITVPSSQTNQYHLKLFTEIITYKENILKDYDSGLTCPKIPNLNRSIKAGDQIEFSYQLGTQPTLLGKVTSAND